MPHGVTGGLFVCFAEVPPPCGWSEGFWAFPLTLGRRPNQRFTPALPLIFMNRSKLESCPIVTQQSKGNFRISVERSFTVMLGILRDDSRIGTSGSDELATSSGPDLEVMDDGASRDRPQW